MNGRLTSRMLRMGMACAFAVSLTACGMMGRLSPFGEGTADLTEPQPALPEPVDAPFPDLGDTPAASRITPREERAGITRQLETRRLYAALERGVMPPDLKGRIPIPAMPDPDPMLPLWLIDTGRLSPSQAAPQNVPPAPPPSAMPPVLPAGGSGSNDADGA